MLNHVQIQQAIKNLNLLSTYPHMSAASFILEDKDKLATNSFYSRNRSNTVLKNYLVNLINEVSHVEHYENNPSYITLYTSLQYFLHLRPNHVLEDLKLNLDQVEYLKRHNLSIEQLVHKHKDNDFKNSVHVKDQNGIEIGLPTINFNSHSGHWTSPDDKKAHQHGSEASNIFFSTQWERFKGLLSGLFEKIGIYVFETARYSEHDYLDNEVYAHDTVVEPRQNNANYQWISHATNLITIPSNDSPINVLTDPFEGDMAPLIYPIMSEEGKLIDGEGDKRLPKIDVVLISHNHRDHVSESTLQRLLKHRPKIIIPRGDRELFLKIGFPDKDIVELEWWEQASIKDHNNKEVLKITAVPASHWSGRGLHDAHLSGFNGYVMNGIYFGGDTALMDNKLTTPIFENFNIMTSIQPGGPDENREDMKSTHQSSADGVLMHFKILAAHYRKMKVNNENPNIETFLDNIEQVKTIFNHTGTFKLGNLRRKDTFFSYQRLIAAFKESAKWREEHLANHELEVFNKILEIAQEMVFADGITLNGQGLVKLILDGVIIPKIGQKLALYSVQEKNLAQTFQYRSLITNRRALIECDAVLKDYVEAENGNEQPLDVKEIIFKLLDSYHSPWHAFLSRTYPKQNMDNFRSKIKGCENLDGVLAILRAMEETLDKPNLHGHMQSLVHYAKWVVLFAQQHEDAALEKFQEYFKCQQVRKLVDQELHNSGSVISGSNRMQNKRLLETCLMN